jgi:outer membrane protein assembly factor BamB
MRTFLFAFCILHFALQSAAQSPAEWTQFRGNPSLTGVAAGLPPASLKVLWSIEAGEAIESSAAIADGRVFVGVASGHLLAVSLADGKELWKYPVEEGIAESSPAVAGGLVFIGDLGGVFHAVNVADGKPAWTFKTKGRDQVLAGRRRRPRADRLVRHAALRALGEGRDAALVDQD